MFSGKSDELLRRIKNAVLAGLKVKAFQPAADNRQSGIATQRWDEKNEEFVPAEIFPATKVNSPGDIYEVLASDMPDVIVFDEAQFFPGWIFEVVQNLLFGCMKKFKVLPQEVLVAGLDMWADGTPAGEMPNLLAMCNNPVKITGICQLCSLPKKPSVMTYKKHVGAGQVEIGNKPYKTVCRDCWRRPK